jgi:hypothetical protein
MGEPVVTAATVVHCAHGGTAHAAAPSPRVRVGGQPVLVQGSPMLVTGCTLAGPPKGPGPDSTASWATGATRVRVDGQALVLTSSTAACVPSGGPLTAVEPRPRVQAV